MTHYFLTGPGGTGKSFYIKKIQSQIKSILLSSTGLSASLIGGQTVHRFFRLGIASNIEELKANDTADLKKYKKTEILLKNTISSLRSADLVIIDEISMINAETLNMIEYRLKQIKIDIPILFVGDLLQLPPVKGDLILKSEAFQNAKPILLKKNWRTKNIEFSQKLNEIRKGFLDENYISQFSAPKNFDDNSYAFLFSTNKEAEAKNQTELGKIKSKTHTFKIKLEIEEKNPSDKELEAFLKNSKIDKELKLKVGARVLITRNMDTNGATLVNGDIGTIKSISKDYVRVSIDRLNQIVSIEEQKTESVAYKLGERVTEFSVTHMPIILAWGITIHKSQGMSIYKLHIDASNLFAPGQFYVAISRAVTPEYLKIYFGSTERDRQRSFRNMRKINIEAKEYYDYLETTPSKQFLEEFKNKIEYKTSQ